jgi:transcriptional antiterminator RfaH
MNAPENNDHLTEDVSTWYCVRTKPRREKLVRQVLAGEFGIEAFSPRIRYPKKRVLRIVLVEEALFPGYVFAKFAYSREYRRVLAGKGVLRIVCFGGRPAEVREQIIHDLRARMTQGETLEVKSGLMEGSLAQIVEGPFEGVQGIIARIIPASRRVALLMNILGSDREIILNSDQLLATVQHPLVQR